MRLSIFYSSTCVGLRYGHLKDSLEDFPGSMESTSSGLAATPSPLGVNGLPDLPSRPSYRLGPGQPLPGWPILLRHPIGSNAFQTVQEY